MVGGENHFPLEKTIFTFGKINGRCASYNAFSVGEKKKGTGSFDITVFAEMHLLAWEHSKLIISAGFVSCRPFVLISVFTDV